MRIGIVIPEYRTENLRLLPWRYIYELSRCFSNDNHEVVVMTDSDPGSPFNDFVGDTRVVRLPAVKHFPPKHFDDIRTAIARVAPDVLVWSMGLTGFLQRQLFASLKVPIVALVTSPVYWRREILRNLGVNEILGEAGLLATSLAGTFVPRFLIRNTLNLDSIKAVAVTSRESKNRFRSMGVNPHKIVHVPPGVDHDFLRPPTDEAIAEARREVCGYRKGLLVTYFGPPLLSRGVDTLIHGTRFAVREQPSLSDSLTVLILSRRRGNEYYGNEKFVRGIVLDCGLQEVVKIRSGFQSIEKVKSYVAASDMVALPFKHVITDVPFGIMEAMSLGKPVLSTRVDGIPELLEGGRGIIVEPRDSRRLGEAIVHFSGNAKQLAQYGDSARKYIREHFRWEDSANSILELVNSRDVRNSGLAG